VTVTPGRAAGFPPINTQEEEEYPRSFGIVALRDQTKETESSCKVIRTHSADIS
jgi:hypothetical protein